MSRNGVWFDELSVNKAIEKRCGQDRHLLDKLDIITEQIKERLNQRLWYEPVAYTPHDFDHHVKTVLQYGSKLLDPIIDKLTLDELLVFQYACLLHDISMAYNPGDREVHAFDGCVSLYQDGYDKLLQEIDKQYASLADEIKAKKGGSYPLTNNINDLIIDSVSKYLFTILSYTFEGTHDAYRDAAGLAILGHSDLKLCNGEIRINTLDKEFYSRTIIQGPETTTNIRIRVLAAILRFADELDCTIKRIDGIPKIVMKGIPLAGQKYWERLKLFTHIDFNIPRVKIYVNTAYIQRNPDRDKLFGLMKEVLEKIEKERQTVLTCMQEENFMYTIGPVKLHFNDDNIKQQYYDYCNATLGE